MRGSGIVVWCIATLALVTGVPILSEQVVISKDIMFLSVILLACTLCICCSIERLGKRKK